jgi:hypothetical protein
MEFFEAELFQIFNPFLQLQVSQVLLRHPFFWMFSTMSLLGYYAGTRIESYLFQRTRRFEKATDEIITSKPPCQFSEQTPKSSVPFQEGLEGQVSFPMGVQKTYDSSTPTKQRPYIKLHIDGLEKVADSAWNNVYTLNDLYSELGFRQPRQRVSNLRERILTRLNGLQKIQFAGGTAISLGSQNLSNDVFKYEEGVLRCYGYKVGINGLTQEERWKILDAVFLQPLVNIDDTVYLSEWGEPKSARRLQKLADSLATFACNAKRRNSDRYNKAIQDWEGDLAYLKRVYYKNHFSFQYPLV